MRKIDSVIIHCSATKAGMDFSVADIDRWHRARGMNGIGYHYVVRLDGTVEKGREVEVAGGCALPGMERAEYRHLLYRRTGYERESCRYTDE